MTAKARNNIDNAVRALWCALRDASDEPGEPDREDDLEAWGCVTAHRAVQDVLDALAK